MYCISLNVYKKSLLCTIYEKSIFQNGMLMLLFPRHFIGNGDVYLPSILDLDIYNPHYNLFPPHLILQFLARCFVFCKHVEPQIL